MKGPWQLMYRTHALHDKLRGYTENNNWNAFPLQYLFVIGSFLNALFSWVFKCQAQETLQRIQRLGFLSVRSSQTESFPFNVRCAEECEAPPTIDHKTVCVWLSRNLVAECIVYVPATRWGSGKSRSILVSCPTVRVCANDAALNPCYPKTGVSNFARQVVEVGSNRAPRFLWALDNSINKERLSPQEQLVDPLI